jgi:hypothetical protein
MGIGKLLATAGAFSASLLSAGEASADYLCSVTYYPGAGTSVGNEGNVRITVYTGPSCTGSFVDTYYLCTGGATANVCSSVSIYRYERSGLLAMFSALQRAASLDQRVTVGTTNACYAGGTSCLANVSFYAD